jgi:predicted amidohydrolase YtcJ
MLLRTKYLIGSALSVIIITSATMPLMANEHKADIIFYGGPILTMEGSIPSYVEAIAVKGSDIIFTGTKKEADALKTDKTIMRDLDGKTLTPGLIDSHAHILSFGAQAVGANLLALPDGDVDTIDDLVARLQEFAKGDDINRTGWIYGMGYDDSILGRHPTRHDLDKVSKDKPVMAIHISGHFSAVNSVGLKEIGYNAETKNPVGGIIRREADGKTPNGVLEELASMPHSSKATTPLTQADEDYFMKKGMAMAKSYGYTTTTEGRLFGDQHLKLKNAAARGLVEIDVIGFQDYTNRQHLDKDFSTEYKNHYRLGGLKVTLDGSPQGRTAWRTIPYVIPPDDQEAGYKGYPTIPDNAEVSAYLNEAYEKNWPVQVHVNGDAAVDQLINNLRPVVEKHGRKEDHVTLIHGQLMRLDQIPPLKELGVFQSMFPLHTFYWGDWYDKIIDRAHADNISPMRTILDVANRATSHSDAPVALPNLMRVVWATTNRTSRTGRIIGEAQRVSPYEAMQMVTIWAADQLGEDDKKGSLKVGKIADMVILSGNPAAIASDEIDDIIVLETFKDGRSIYQRDQDIAFSKKEKVKTAGAK